MISNLNKRKAIIFGIKGTNLSYEMKLFLKSENPWGIILFSRNVKDFFQLKKLVSDIKQCFNDKNYPILIDQEGGRVSRLDKIINLKRFSPAFFGSLYQKDKKKFNSLYKIYTDTICDLLKNVGINIITVPVLDVRRPNANKIIGDRSFSSNPKIVEIIGRLCVELHNKNKILTVVKHMPGHGLSKIDSHYGTPIVNANKKELINKDFKPFKNCHSFLAMTAHVIYTNYDPFSTATHSENVIRDVIRKHIGFKGILISDDISMKSLKLGLVNNAKKAIKSGCNLILHCNGDMNEMKKLVKFVPKINKFTKKKTSDLYKFLG